MLPLLSAGPLGAGPLVSAGQYDTAGPMAGLRWVALGVTVACLTTGLVRRRRQQARRAAWHATTGLVDSEEFTGYAGGDTSYYDKVISFRTRDRQQIRGVPRNGSYLGTPVVGRQVPVWYDPRNPNRFEARVHWTDDAGSFVLLVAGLGALLTAVSLLP